MTNFKQKPARSPNYLAFIRGQPCCLTGATQGIEAHHENEPGKSTMGGKCCDSRAVPIQWQVHAKMESPGNSRPETWAKYGVDPEKVIEEMKARWVKKGGKVFW